MGGRSFHSFSLPLPFKTSLPICNHPFFSSHTECTYPLPYHLPISQMPIAHLPPPLTYLIFRTLLNSLNFIWWMKELKFFPSLYSFFPQDFFSLPSENMRRNAPILAVIWGEITCQVSFQFLGYFYSFLFVFFRCWRWTYGRWWSLIPFFC